MATRAGSAGARRTTTGQPAFSAAQTQAGAFSGKCAGAMPRSKSWGSGPALRRIGSGASRRRLEPRCELFAMTTARS
ncbi:hypothetical protein PA18A_1146 [Pseudomonas aeruginosa 18A]|nr:phosphoribosyl-dephospho-CoA transferase domain protein [Pseudomonas aeruginosa]CCQ84563.1 hypothetical protein PA18A_1146 [Pseudomonas aeruginosa 18A]